MAHSSSGLGHHPLKVEIAGSNPACATKLDKIQNLRAAVPSGPVICPWFHPGGTLFVPYVSSSFMMGMDHFIYGHGRPAAAAPHP